MDICLDFSLIDPVGKREADADTQRNYFHFSKLFPLMLRVTALEMLDARVDDNFVACTLISESINKSGSEEEVEKVADDAVRGM